MKGYDWAELRNELRNHDSTITYTSHLMGVLMGPIMYWTWSY